tara:strand:+ start:12894 stop:13589 length:696 start_codon:yes stop_codon:yes gene_type:complete
MNNSIDKISVIMSVYNSEETLVNCVESIMNQTYENFDLLIIDDFSQDNSFETCKAFEKEFNNIFVFRNNENLGLTKSLNKLLNLATGNFIARQDADDFSEPNRFERQMENIIKYNLDGCTTRSIVQNSSRVIPKYSHYLPPKFVIKFKNPFIHGSLIMKTSIFKKLGGYDENFYFSQDYKLMSDCIKSGHKLKIINEKLYHLNMENNISNKYKSEQKYYSDCVRKNINPLN